MGCRNRGFSDGEENNAVTASLSDTLLFTTMCIIGLPVDVHAKDGSIYSGIFYTACVDEDYAIVLKKARMIKKGDREANVANGSLIETFIIQSEDIVQVVAKGVPFLANGVFGKFDGDDVVSISGNIQFSDSEAKATKCNESKKDRKLNNVARSSSHVENGFPHDLTTRTTSYSGSLEDENGNSDARDFVEEGEDSSVSANGRQFGDGSDVERKDCAGKLESRGDQTADVVRGSSSVGNAGENRWTAAENVLAQTNFNGVRNDMSSDGLTSATVKPDDQSHEKHTLEDTPPSNAVSAGACADATLSVDVTLDSSVSSSFASTESVPPKSSNCNRPAKESKLNPGAKIFSPSPLHQRSAMTPPIPTVPSVTYIPDPCQVAPVTVSQPEFEISQFAPRSSMPVKFVPYNNLLVGNGGTDPQYSYPVIGHTGNRIQPVRYQYHHLQAGPTFMHPNSQNVMVGRMGQVVYLHPLAHDVHSAAGFSQVSARPLLAPHQVHLPKHQGSGTAQALQLCITPPLIAGGQQPFVMPGHLPVSQPPFPVVQPITVPGPNGFLNTKLA